MHLTCGKGNLYKEIALSLKGVEWRQPGLVALASTLARGGAPRKPIELNVPSTYVPSAKRRQAPERAMTRRQAKTREVKKEAAQHDTIQRLRDNAAARKLQAAFRAALIAKPPPWLVATQPRATGANKKAQPLPAPAPSALLDPSESPNLNA